MASKRYEITDRQKEVYSYLVWHVCEYGYQPTIVELAENFGVHLNAIKQILGQLDEKGYIRLPGERAERRIEICGVKFKPVEADYPDPTLV